MIVAAGCKVEPDVAHLAGLWKVDQGTSVVKFGSDGAGEVYKDGFLPGKIGGPCDSVPCEHGSACRQFSAKFQSQPWAVCIPLCSSQSSCSGGASCTSVPSVGQACWPITYGFPAQPVEARVDSFNTFNIVMTEGSASPGVYMCYGCRLESNDSIKCDDIVGNNILGSGFLNSCNLVRVSSLDGGGSPKPDASTPVDASGDVKKE
jgi:hypothetical protein